MDLQYFFNSLALIKPELSVSGVIVLLLLADLFVKDKRPALYGIAFAGIAVTAYYCIEQLGGSAIAFAGGNSKGMVAVDPFAAYFKLLVLLSTLLVLLFTAITKELDSSMNRIGEYFALIFAMVLGMFFMAAGTDLLLLYLSLEMVSLSSYVLAGFIKESERSGEASLKYVIYGATASGIMLFGISLFFGMTGSTNLFDINMMFHTGNLNLVLLLVAGIMVFAGIGYKISSVPFHFWTPDVYEGAPTPITAYLSVASKAAGFAMLIRILKVAFVDGVAANGMWLVLPVFNWKLFLMVTAVLTMTLGNLTALWQDNVKRMLAYSSIAHAGYLLAALAVLSNEAVISILIYFGIYLLMNLGAFLAVIVISNKTGSENVDDYDGLGYKMPLLGITLGIFLVSLTGLPPTAGFIGKLYIFLAMIDAKMVWLALIALLNSVVSLYYYIRVLKHMYLNRPKEEVTPETPVYAEAALLAAIAAPVLIFGIYFTPLVNFAKYSASILGL